MKDSAVYLLYKLLRKNKIFIDEEEVKFQLLSHPTYPSLHSITGVLDHFNIENIAAKISTDHETLSQLDSYFLTQIKNDTGEHFVIFIKDKDKINLVFSREYTQSLSEEEFLKIWTGIILIIDPSDTEINTGAKSSKKRPIAITIPLIFLGISLFLLQPKFPILFHFFLSCIALAFSILIILKELGHQSNTLNRFCSLGKDKASCDAVLNSKGALLFKSIKLSDLGIIYFSSLAFYSFLALISHGNFDLVYILSLLVIPFTFYSIFYQWRVVKSWCSLCLCIVAILWLQTIPVFLFDFDTEHLSLSTSSILLFLFSFSFMTIIWSYVLPLLKKEIELRNLKIDHYRFKRNYTIFDTLLSKSTPLPIGIIDPNEIVLGNTSNNAKLNITIITNTSCGHCKEVHTLVEKLLNRNAEEIQVVIRFNVSAKDVDNDNAKITTRITELYHTEGEEKCLKAMHDIYMTLKAKNWLEKWGVCTNENYLKTIEQQSIWCEEHNKNFTPEILIEGLSFPKEYKREDLLYFVESLIEE